MIKALLLILDPENTWAKIEQSPHSAISVFFTYLLPLLLLSSAVEAWGIMQLGYDEGDLMARRMKAPQELVVRYATAQIGLGIITAFCGAWLLKRLAEGFHRRHKYKEAFATIAYALGPLLLVRMLDALPVMNTWLCWGLGAALAVAVLYRGIPRIMKPDPSNALGLYLTSSFLLIALTGFSHYLSQLVLQEKLLKNLPVPAF